RSAAQAQRLASEPPVPGLSPAFTAAKVQVHARLLEKYADQLDVTDRDGVQAKITELAEDYFRTNTMTLTKMDRERLIESLMCDARLKDGSRVNVIIPPLALKGPCMTIRKFSKDKLGPNDLLHFGSATPQMIQFLQACVRARLNVLVSGGTGSGKTTLLNILSSFIPENERLITCEDAAELQLQQPHWIQLESRPPNVEGKGAVPIRELVKSCLRMRPDRIIVGECRGGEALDMLQAMNTGHDG